MEVANTPPSRTRPTLIAEKTRSAKTKDKLHELSSTTATGFPTMRCEIMESGG